MSRALVTALLALALATGLCGPAAAHRLKVFATVADGMVSGYAFFIGGGRPQGARVMIRTPAGADLARLATGMDGAFSAGPFAGQDMLVVVDAGDGHVAEAHIAAERFGAAPPSTSDRSVTTGSAAGDPDPAALAALVDAAVARQVRPLLEAYEAAEGRVRFNDVVGGLGALLGMAGAALWVAARRRAGNG